MKWESWSKFVEPVAASLLLLVVSLLRKRKEYVSRESSRALRHRVRAVRVINTEELEKSHIGESAGQTRTTFRAVNFTVREVSANDAFNAKNLISRELREQLYVRYL